MEKTDNRLNELIKQYSGLFNKYDFFIAREIPENAYKAIDIGAGLYVIFTHKDIKETINERLQEYISEQNQNGWADMMNEIDVNREILPISHK